MQIEKSPRWVAIVFLLSLVLAPSLVLAQDEAGIAGSASRTTPAASCPV